MTKPNERGGEPLRKLVGDADPRGLNKIKKDGPSPELVSMLAKMSDQERTLALIKAARCLPVQRAMWGLR